MRAPIDLTGERVSSRPFPLNNQNCPVIWTHCLTALTTQNVAYSKIYASQSLNHFIPHANKYVSCRPFFFFFRFFLLLLYFLRERCFNVSRLQNRIIAVSDKSPTPTLPHGCVWCEPWTADQSIKIPRLNSEKANLAHRIEMLLYPILFCCCCCWGCRRLWELDDVGGQVKKKIPLPVEWKHGVKTNGSVSFTISNRSGASRIAKTLWRIYSSVHNRSCSRSF